MRQNSRTLDALYVQVSIFLFQLSSHGHVADVPVLLRRHDLQRTSVLGKTQRSAGAGGGGGVLFLNDSWPQTEIDHTSQQRRKGAIRRASTGQAAFHKNDINC